MWERCGEECARDDWGESVDEEIEQMALKKESHEL